MSFTEARARMDDAVFRRFGEDASYVSPHGQVSEGVRIIRKEADDESRFADSRMIMPTYRIRVRRSDIAKPEEGGRFVLNEDGSELTLVVTGEPMANARRTIWTVGYEPEDVSR